jgi:hypothetical protein
MHQKRIDNPDLTCPRHTKKPYRLIIQAAWDAGWWCDQRRKGYIQCYPPDDGEVVTVPATPGGGRTLQNLTARFRRSGLDV